MARFGTSTRWLLTLGSLWTLLACDEPKCFAPGKNLDRAYDEGAVGCGCSAKDEDQCIDGVALICEGGQWHAVQDGPCYPEPGEVCGEDLCSQYGQCMTFPDGGQGCVSTLFDSGAAAEPATQEMGSTEGGAQASDPTEAGVAEAGIAQAEAGSPAQPAEEPCGSATCSEYEWCSTAEEDAGPKCRAKRDVGGACSEARMCLSALCSGASCQPDTRHCVGTWDTSESFAKAICGNRDCHVCVQEVDEAGTAVVFAAVEPASCACPRPSVRSASSASDAGEQRDR